MVDRVHACTGVGEVNGAALDVCMGGSGCFIRCIYARYGKCLDGTDSDGGKESES